MTPLVETVNYMTSIIEMQLHDLCNRNCKLYDLCNRNVVLYDLCNKN
jgi:hypothetical protein